MTDYAVFVLRYMVQQHGRALSAQQLAHGTGIPKPSVANIMKKLVISGVCSSQQGSAGGYALAIPAADISLWQVIQAMDGASSVSRCLEQEGACEHEHHCELKPQWQQLDGLFRGILGSIDFEQLKMPLMQHPLLQAISSSLSSYQTEGVTHG